MTIDTRLPASSAGLPTTSFGTASVRLFAPQYVFELVRQQAIAGHSKADGSAGPPPHTANQNEQAHRSAAA
jgi:hypothetical protein